MSQSTGLGPCSRGVKVTGDHLRLIIDELSPSLNRLLRTHWSQRVKLIERWSWLLIAERGRKEVPKGYVRVTIARYTRTKLLDADNLVGGCKVVVDAMKRAGLIVDDSPDYIELVCLQTKYTKNFTEVTIQKAEKPC